MLEFSTLVNEANADPYRINNVGVKTKGIVRVASTQNFEDFKGFSVLNPFSKTLIADIECKTILLKH